MGLNESPSDLKFNMKNESLWMFPKTANHVDIDMIFYVETSSFLHSFSPKPPKRTTQNLKSCRYRHESCRYQHDFVIQNLVKFGTLLLTIFDGSQIMSVQIISVPAWFAFLILDQIFNVFNLGVFQGLWLIPSSVCSQVHLFKSALRLFEICR